MTEADEPCLVRFFRAGDPEACAELVRAHYQAVYRFLVHLTRDVHKAEDLTQDTFTVAWEKRAKFQGRSALATWLHRIAYRRFIDAQRAGLVVVTLERNTRTIATLKDPLHTVIAGDDVRQLYQVLHALDTQERTLLVLHYLQGFSYREMSAVLDEPSGTVKWRTALALNRLRVLLTDEVPDHAPR